MIKHRLVPPLILCSVVALKSFAQSANETRGCSADDCSGRIEAVKMSERPNGFPNGRNTVFTMSHIPLLELPMSLSRNGIGLMLGRDFSVMRDRLILTVPPDSGDSLSISYYSLPALAKGTTIRHTAFQTSGNDSLVASFCESAARSALIAEDEDSKRTQNTGLNRLSTRQDEESKGVDLLLERTRSHLSNKKPVRDEQASTAGFEGLGDRPFRTTKTGANGGVISEDDKLLQLLQKAIRSNAPPVGHD